MAINAMIPMKDTHVDVESFAETRRNALANRQREQAIAAQDLATQEYESQAPQRERKAALELSNEKRQFMESWLPHVGDDNSLKQMRDEAVGIWGQEADDNMPTAYDPEIFDTLRTRLGVSSVSDREKFNQREAIEAAKQSRYEGLKGSQQLDYLKDKGGVDVGIARDKKRSEQEVIRDTVADINVESQRGNILGKEAATRSIPATETDIAEAKGVMSVIDELTGFGLDEGEEAFDLDVIYGKHEGFMPNVLRSQEGIDAMAKRDRIVDSLNLMAAGKLKGQGQITENERAMLARAATTLSNHEISPEMAKDELIRVKAKFGEVMDRGSNSFDIPRRDGQPSQQAPAQPADYSENEVVINGDNRFQMQNGKMVFIGKVK